LGTKSGLDGQRYESKAYDLGIAMSIQV
jgi:hypothetical protein